MTCDPHDVLGVPRDFTPDQLREAWRRAAAQLHPDRGGSREEFERARLAYEYLRDPQMRQRVNLGEIDLKAALEEISERFGAALPDLESLCEELRSARAPGSWARRIAAGARAVLHGTAAYDRLRRR